MNEGQGGLVNGGTYSAPVQQPVMNTPIMNTAGAGDIVINNGKQKKSWKKWVILGAVGIVIVGVILLVVASVNKLSVSSVEEVQNAYWAYMNYLIRGEESEEVLEKNDYIYLDSVAREEFEQKNVEYFEKLNEYLDVFNDVLARRAHNSNSDVAITFAQKLNELVNFVIYILQTESLDEQELMVAFVSGENLVDLEKNKLGDVSSIHEVASEYVEYRLEFAETYSKLGEMAKDAGCIDNTSVKVLCLYDKNMGDEYMKLSQRLDAIKRSISRMEVDAMSRLAYNSWAVWDLMYEERND